MSTDPLSGQDLNLSLQGIFELFSLFLSITASLREDFEASLDRIANKIQDFQKEILSYMNQSRDPERSFRKISSSHASTFRSKKDMQPKENKDTTPQKSSKKQMGSTSLHSKSPISPFQTFREDVSDFSRNQTCRRFSSIRESIQIDEKVEDIFTLGIRQKLKRIFGFYIRVGDKGVTSQLKLAKFRKMMTDCRIIEPSMTLENLELLFLRQSKHRIGVDFEGFLELLVKISTTKYTNSQYTNKEALQIILDEYILPLNNVVEPGSMIFDGIDMGKEKDEIIEEGVLLVIKGVYPVLIKIYKEFFSWELKEDKQKLLKKKNKEGFWNFLKEFEICPGFITKAIGNNLWAQICENPNELIVDFERSSEMKVWFKNKDLGVSFKFTKFCEILVKIAFIAYKQQGEQNNRKLNQAEQLILLLERMEFSPGMAKFAQQGKRFVPKDILEKVNYFLKIF